MEWINTVDKLPEGYKQILVIFYGEVFSAILDDNFDEKDDWGFVIFGYANHETHWIDWRHIKYWSPMIYPVLPKDIDDYSIHQREDIETLDKIENALNHYLDIKDK